LNLYITYATIRAALLALPYLQCISTLKLYIIESLIN